MGRQIRASRLNLCEDSIDGSVHRRSNRTSVVKTTTLQKNFTWKSYPDLREFLVANRMEYLRHKEMGGPLWVKYDNSFTKRLLEFAASLNYNFDKNDFDFDALRTRIRTFYYKKNRVLIGNKKKYVWKNLPELEKLLIENKDEYLRHNEMPTVQRKKFVNRLTACIMEAAANHDYVFGHIGSTFPSVRFCIQCYYAGESGNIVEYGAQKPAKKLKLSSVSREDFEVDRNDGNNVSDTHAFDKDAPVMSCGENEGATNTDDNLPFCEGDEVVVQDGEYCGRTAKVIEAHTLCVIVRIEEDGATRLLSNGAVSGTTSTRINSNNEKDSRSLNKSGNGEDSKRLSTGRCRTSPNSVSLFQSDFPVESTATLPSDDEDTTRSGSSNSPISVRSRLSLLQQENENLRDTIKELENENQALKSQTRKVIRNYEGEFSGKELESSNKCRKTIIRQRFFWRSYPELVAFLNANQEECVRYSATHNRHAMGLYNKDLTKRLMEEAAKHNYIFDESHFTPGVVTGRIRNYYLKASQS